MARRKRALVAALVGVATVTVIAVGVSAPRPISDFQQQTEAYNDPSSSTPAPTASPTPTPSPTASSAPSTGSGGSGGSSSGSSGSSSSVTTASVQTTQAPPTVLRKDFSTPTRVDRVTVSISSGTATTGSLVFSDGSRLLVTPNSAGDATVSFPERTVSWATMSLHLADGTGSSASVDAWNVDFDGQPPTNTLSQSLSTTTPWASSNGGDPGARALIDGDPATGRTGNEWAPNASDLTPTVGLRWDSPQEIASVQIVGSSTTAFDPAYAQAAELYGELVFDDGSTVSVAGIDAAEGQPTTVAFTPRMTSSVALRISRTIAQAQPAIREFRAYPRGVTPPRWAGGLTAAGASVSAASAGSCSTSSTPVGSTTDGSPALVCPAVGASVPATATVVVRAPAGAVMDGSAWVIDNTGAGSLQRVASATADSNGFATLTFDTTSIMRGPFALKVVNRGATTTNTRTPLYVQLYNPQGRTSTAQTSFAPAGMTLAWSDDFRSPLVVTQSGSGAAYAATKPAYWGNSEFGEAYFAPPSENRNTLATLENEYLRIRVQPIGKQDPWGWNRQYESGLLSSLKVGATGFSAQYGYYEARVLAGAGRGTWPAFWMLDADSATKRLAGTQGEVDAFELYGHDAMASCHAVHSWRGNTDEASTVQCLYPNGASDWAASWHTYGVQIKPGGADYYIDGRLVKSLGNFFNSTDPFYFMLNLSLGGGYPIKLTGTGNTVDMYVDWVRVYT